MANEDQVAYWTDRIANALVTARGPLEAVAHADDGTHVRPHAGPPAGGSRDAGTGADRVRAAEEAARSVEKTRTVPITSATTPISRYARRSWRSAGCGVMTDRIRNKLDDGGLR